VRGRGNAKRAGLCQLRDLLVTTPEPLPGELRPLTRARLLQRLAATRPERRHDQELRGALLALRSVARRVLQLTAEERELAREIETITRKLAPQLLDQPGVGPLAAAQLVLSWSHRGRITSEAAFARLAGCAPIPASSGQTVRYRLDRSGDRRLNRALHMILVTRRRKHPPTIAYIERRIQEGKSRREAIRCLKRYLARNLYRLLEHGPPLDLHRSITLAQTRRAPPRGALRERKPRRDNAVALLALSHPLTVVAVFPVNVRSSPLTCRISPSSLCSSSWLRWWSRWPCASRDLSQSSSPCKSDSVLTPGSVSTVGYATFLFRGQADPARVEAHDRPCSLVSA
jgi:hypothetical protein